MSEISTKLEAAGLRVKSCSAVEPATGTLQSAPPSRATAGRISPCHARSIPYHFSSTMSQDDSGAEAKNKLRKLLLGYRAFLAALNTQETTS